MEKILIIFAITLSICGCSSSNDATKALKANGFTDIQTHGRAFFACSEDDTFATKFTAKNTEGKSVTGAVCSGWLKGATIRYD
ncbi:hypothetical protein N5J44_00125 [Acinetobacter ursingii]|uniref:hypothetical protein n=1 Tax=Acinetobacter ursingii TaxID=108980 RepID=UPI002449D895|nr:hypothetical protein [Acinetobacter ursingii]MDH2017870.1 hypothetical protein [Acinetobacter ursingii]MDH2069969.1 hypothetical protein [Acinetobacter ursingii]